MANNSWYSAPRPWVITKNYAPVSPKVLAAKNVTFLLQPIELYTRGPPIWGCT